MVLTFWRKICSTFSISKVEIKAELLSFSITHRTVQCPLELWGIISVLLTFCLTKITQSEQKLTMIHRYVFSFATLKYITGLLWIKSMWWFLNMCYEIRIKFLSKRKTSKEQHFKIKKEINKGGRHKRSGFVQYVPVNFRLLT